MALPTQTLFERDGSSVQDDAFVPLASAFGNDRFAVIGGEETAWTVKIYRANVNGSIDSNSRLLAEIAGGSIEYFWPQMLIVETRLYIAFRAISTLAPARGVVLTYRINEDLSLTLENTRNHQEPGQPVNKVVADPINRQFLINTYDGVRTGSRIFRAQAGGPVDSLTYQDPQIPMPPAGGQHRYYTGLAYWQDQMLMYLNENGENLTISQKWKIGRSLYNSVGSITFSTGGVDPEAPASFDNSQTPPFLFIGPTSGAMRSGGTWHKINLATGQYPSSPKTITLAGASYVPSSDAVPVDPQVQPGIAAVYGVGKVSDGVDQAMVIRRDLFDPAQNIYGPSDAAWTPQWAHLTSQGKWLVYSTNGTQQKVSQWGDEIPLVLDKNPFRGSKYFLYTAGPGAIETSLLIRGPLGSQMYADRHLGNFLISPNRMVSIQFRIATVSKVVLDVYAQWLRIANQSFVRESEDPLIRDLVVEFAEDPDVWTVVNANTTQVPTNVSHWRPRLVFSRLVDGVKQPLTAGTPVALDSFYVPENGRPLAGQEYLDGDQPGGRWEGQPHNSPSVLGIPDPVSGPNITVPESIVIVESP